MKKGESTEFPVGLHFGAGSFGVAIFNSQEEDYICTDGRGKKADYVYKHPYSFPLPNVDALTESGFVVHPKTSGFHEPLLIEIAGIRYLMDIERGLVEDTTVASYLVNHHWRQLEKRDIKRSNIGGVVLDEIPSNIDTVEKAKEYLIPSKISLNSNHKRSIYAFATLGDWVLPMSEDFEPPSVLDVFEEDIARTMPLPQDYDLPEEIFEPKSYNDENGQCTLKPHGLYLEDSDEDPWEVDIHASNNNLPPEIVKGLIDYVDAANAHRDAKKAYYERTKKYIFFKGSALKSYNKIASYVRRTPEGTFIKGALMNGARGKTLVFKQWHRIFRNNRS
jgi:hypothetical protein